LCELLGGFFFFFGLFFPKGIKANDKGHDRTYTIYRQKWALSRSISAKAPFRKAFYIFVIVSLPRSPSRRGRRRLVSTEPSLLLPRTIFLFCFSPTAALFARIGGEEDNFL
jgi:hypothetical protein